VDRDSDARLDELLAQENELQLDSFTNADAVRIGLRLLEIAQDDGLPIAIDIARNGHQLFHAGLPGRSPDNDLWIQRKNRVVNNFGHSSLYMGLRYRSQNSSIETKSLLPESQYAPHGGAFPVIIKNVGVVGTITVSGLPQEDDHALVVRVLREIIDAP